MPESRIHLVARPKESKYNNRKLSVDILGPKSIQYTVTWAPKVYNLLSEKCTIYCYLGPKRV